VVINLGALMKLQGCRQFLNLTLQASTNVRVICFQVLYFSKLYLGVLPNYSITNEGCFEQKRLRTTVLLYTLNTLESGEEREIIFFAFKKLLKNYFYSHTKSSFASKCSFFQMYFFQNFCCFSLEMSRKQIKRMSVENSQSSTSDVTWISRNST